jgi:hypothetical protein
LDAVGRGIQVINKASVHTNVMPHRWGMRGK